MSNVKVLTGTGQINMAGFPAHENWQTGDTLVTPGNVAIMVAPGIAEAGFGDGDATPDVSGGTDFYTQNSAPTTITSLVGGTAGHRVRLRIADANTTISGTLTLSGRTIAPCVAGEELEWIHDGVTWHQIGGSVGMGSRPVIVDPVDSIADWVLSSTIAWGPVTDLSDDSVRKGASMVKIRAMISSTTVVSALACRPNGSADAGNGVFVGAMEAINVLDIFEFSCGVDDGARLQLRYNVAFTAGTNLGWVAAYWI